jgi:hypothetical protein
VPLHEPGEGSEISLQKLKDHGNIPKRWHQFEIIDIIPEENMLVLETNRYDFSTTSDIIFDDIMMKIEALLNSIPSGIYRKVGGLDFDYKSLREWKLPTKLTSTGKTVSIELVKEIVEGTPGDGQTGGRKKSNRKSSRRTRKYSKKSNKKSSKSKNKRRKH